MDEFGNEYVRLIEIHRFMIGHCVNFRNVIGLLLNCDQCVKLVAFSKIVQLQEL